MNWLLILANVVAFAIQRQMPQVTSQYQLNARDPRLLNFITYAFLHLEWLHLVGNILVLYIFGNGVNLRLGHVGYLAFYLAGGIFAACAFVAMQSGWGMLGASGAVGAVMGAYMVLFPRATFNLRGHELPSTWVIVDAFMFNLAMSLTPWTNVAYGAHMAGMLFGFWANVGLLALGLLPRNPWDLLGLVHRWHRRRTYQALVREGFDPFANPTQRSDEPAPDPKRIRELREQIERACAGRNIPHATTLFIALRKIDAAQVLPQQAQLDVANELFSDHLFTQAADAYEQFLRHYGHYEQVEQVQLILGLIYARYVRRDMRARECLNAALTRLRGEREIQTAREELARLEKAGAN